MVTDQTRRRFIATTGIVGTTFLAGCTGFGQSGGDDRDESMDTEMETETGMQTEMADSMTEMETDGAAMMSGQVDPAEAPRAMVDRFSEAAGTLMVRTEGNGLPGPNEPIDYDRSPFLTRGFGPNGDPVSYYNFDVQPTDPAPIYALFREGEDTPVEGQLNIVDAIPGDEGYNDFWHVHRVTVPDDYEANTATSFADVEEAGYDVRATETIKNCPIVPDGSSASKRYGDGSADLVEGWYEGRVVSYFLFEEAPLTSRNGMVPVSPIYVSFNTNPGEDGGGPPSGFMTEADSEQTHNVIATLPGDDGYSPLWLVNMYDNADFEAVSDLASATQANQLVAGAATVNCPVVAGGMSG